MADQRRINVGLSFSADTSQARQELAKLKDELTKTISTSKIGQVTDLKFDKAIKQAAELRGILEGATDSVGNFDLTKFTRQLNASGMSMQTVYSSLKEIGAEHVFNDLAAQIQNSNANVQLLHGSLKKFAQGLMNTAMWTVQSNAIHAVQSALQGAYNYAQKLNKGLTDIAIVSNLSTQQLTEFARTANEMAKELSASTSDYVSGALIYYQAGLTDEQVIERTNTTIKLAQTSGETAEQISSYMTAIWNNFYDGSKSVEYYADAISYLGAVTAASNADIAEGMQAFSAVANTVGLSFEYGASALTLLRDITQQSASTIGNSLKTIFARLSSVAQGESLEDGVDLTKYSKALDQVGVSVLDATGNLRQMNDILDDLGARWNSLNEAQKVALAQTVGGVRQYNNLISLMDNYEKFQELVAETGGSEGFLQEQADKYAESWEGAKNRLTAAWQGIYQQILDDKFFINLTKFLTFIVNTIGDIIDGMGGLKGMVPFFIAVFTSINPEKTALGIEKLVQELKYLKEALTGVTTSDNVNLKNLTAALQTGSLNTDNKEIFGLVDQLNTALAERNDLETKGNSGYAEKDVLAQRLANQLNYALKLDEELNNIINKYENLPAAKEYADLAKKQSQIIDDFTNAKSGKERFAIVTYAKENNIFDKKVFENLKPEMTKVSREMADKLETEMTGALAKTISNMEKAVDTDRVNVIKKIFGDDAENQNQIDKITEAVKKVGEAAKDVNGDQELWEKEVEKIAHHYGLAKEKLQELALTLGGAKKDAEAMRNLPPAKMPKDWSQMLTSATRAASSLLSMSSAFSALYDNIAKGQANFSNVIASLSSMAMAGNILKGVLGTGLPKSIINKLIPATAAAGEAGKIALAKATAGISLLITGLTLAIVLVRKFLQSWNEKKYAESPAGRIEAANKALEEQKTILKDLTSDYKTLQSTISSLADEYEELGKQIKGSAAYVIALQNYNNQLDELEEKYGNIFDLVDGIRVVNEDKFNNAVLAQIFATQQLMANASRAVKEGERDQAFNNINNFDDLTKKTSRKSVDTDGLSWTTEYKNETYYYLDETHKILDSKLKRYGEEVQKFVEESADLNAGNFEEELKKLLGVNNDNDPLYKFFVNRIALYKQSIDALTKQDSSGGILSFVKSNLMDKGLYSIPGVNETDLDNAVQEVINKRKTQLETEEGTEANAIDFVAQLGFKDYDINEKIAYKVKEDGTRDTENLINLPDIIATYISSVIGTEFTNMSTDDIVNALGGNGLTPDQLSLWREQQRQAEELKWANDEVDAVDGLNHADESFKSLRESVRASADELERLSENVETDEAALTQVAKAVEQTNKGFDALEKGWGNWKTILKEGLAKNDISDYNDALTGTVDALADIMNISDEVADSGYQLGSIFRDYVAANLDVVEAALAGDTDAILRLQEVATQDTLYQMAEKNAEALGLTEEQFSALADYVGNTWDTIRGMLEDGELRVGDNINDGPLMDALTNIINNVAATEEEAEKILADMGFDAEVETDSESTRGTAQYPIPATYTTGIINTGAGPWTYPVLDKAPSMEEIPTTMETPVHALKIKTSKYVGGGNILTKKGGTSAGAARVKNTRPSGGGGGSQKARSKEKERYHEINAKIEQNAHALEMLNKEESRAYGQDKLDLMDEKIKLLEEQAKLYEQLAEEAKNYYEQDKANLEKYGASFNKDGTIANYDQWYGAWISKYLNNQISEEQMKELDDFIKKYEDSLKHLNDAEKNHADAMNEIYDQKLEKVEYRLKTITKILDTHIEYLDYVIDKLDEDAYDAAEQLAKMGEKADKILDKINEYRKDLTGIFENHGINSTIIQQFLEGTISVEDMLKQVDGLTQEEIDTMYNYIGALLKLNKELENLRKDAYEQLGQVIDKMNEKLEDQRDIMDELSKVMSHYKNIIDVVGRDMLGITSDMMNQMAEMQVVTAQGLVQNSRARKEALEEILANLQAERALITDENSADAKYLDEQIKKTQEELADATEQWWTDFENATQRIDEARKTMAENAVLDFEKMIAGTLGSLDALQDFYDKEKKVRDLYLKDYQRIYDLNKLSRDVAKALDNTDSIGGTQRLLELQQEILDLQMSGKDINEYDVGVLQRKLELEQARIAMEEAQNAKNMVRMTRDNEGNWSYTYTADASAIDNARENYENKLYELEKFIDERQESLQSLFLENLKDYMNDLGIAEEDRVEYIKEHYDEIQAKYADFLGDTFKDNQWIINNFDVLDHNLAATWDDLLLSQATGYDTLDGFMQTYVGSSQQAATAVSTAWGWMRKAMEETFKLAGVPMEDFAKKMADYLSKVKEKTDKAAESSRDFAKEAEKAYQAALKAIHDFRLSYGLEIDAILAKNLEAYKQIEKLIEQYSRLDTSRNTPTEPTPEPTPTTQPEPQPQPQPTPQPASGGGDGVPNVGDEVTFEWGDYHSDSYGGGPHGSRGHGQKFKITYMAPGRPYPIHIGSYGWLSQAQISGYDTGGYTGAWGPNGRIAMLHEKELVLNKADTENLLATVGFVRDLTRMISINAADASTGLGNLFSTGVGQGGGYLDQTVTIHAEFPNAINHSEIEEAFNNLIGLAGQYAGRKR